MNYVMTNEVHESLLAAVEQAFCEAIKRVKEEEMFSLSDMYVTFRPEELLLSLYDDNDALLTQIVLENFEDTEEAENEAIIALLQQALERKETAEAFGSLNAAAPVSVILLGDEREIVCELKTFDDDKIFLEEDILKRAGEELDEFFERLMSDIK